MIVLEGLKGRPVAELCNAYQISPAQYYQWRDQFLANASRAFETQTMDQRMTHLQRENAKLKGLIPGEHYSLFQDLLNPARRPDRSCHVLFC